MDKTPLHQTYEKTAPSKNRWLRIVILLLIYGVLLAVGHWGSGWLVSVVGADISPDTETHARHIAMAGLALYSALMAVPFVPGMEISIALLSAFGHQIALFIYIATTLALSISFLVGRLVPARLIAWCFERLGLHSAEQFVRQIGPLSAKQRIDLMLAHAPRRIVPTLLKHRYIAIAVALNLPGNALIGGGGGIALLAGISGLFTLPRYVATIAVAVMPVPLIVYLSGT